VDGVEVTPAFTAEATDPRPDDSALAFTINNNGLTGFAGAVDEVRMYGRVLSAAEVMRVYEATR
jgi:hypothetical protein